MLQSGHLKALALASVAAASAKLILHVRSAWECHLRSVGLGSVRLVEVRCVFTTMESYIGVLREMADCTLLKGYLPAYTKIVCIRGSATICTKINQTTSRQQINTS